MNRQWTPAEAREWYKKYPWIRGCNFIGSDCCSRIDMWQSYHSDEHLLTADNELALAEKLGFNTIRLLIEFDVWAQEHDSFMTIFESYISLAAKHKITVLPVLANEAVISRGEFRFKPLGEQKYYLGYHQGRLPLTPEQSAQNPVHPLEVVPYRTQYLQMVTEIVKKYADDTRILAWDVYNEPGIILKERSRPLIRLLFDTVRACDPSQPLMADIFRPIKCDEVTDETDRLSLSLSDVISFHGYWPYEKLLPMIEVLKKEERPIFMTEWLNRIMNNTVKEIYPLLYLENIACWCWGFVLGKTQTNEPWDSLWLQYENGTHPEYDFTKWMHDLYRPGFHPYDPHEIELIRQYNDLADRRRKP